MNKKQFIKYIGPVPSHVVIPPQWDYSTTYAAYLAGRQDQHQRILDAVFAKGDWK